MIVKPARSRTTIVSSLLIALTFAAPAKAETRTTSFATFLHIGPGRQYAVTDEVPSRTAVDVTACENNWCRIRYGAALGWIDRRMLTAAAPAPAASPTECVDFARTGWPNAGDHERVCLQSAPSR